MAVSVFDSKGRYVGVPGQNLLAPILDQPELGVGLDDSTGTGRRPTTRRRYPRLSPILPLSPLSPPTRPGRRSSSPWRPRRRPRGSPVPTTAPRGCPRRRIYRPIWDRRRLRRFKTCPGTGGPRVRPCCPPPRTWPQWIHPTRRRRHLRPRRPRRRQAHPQRSSVARPCRCPRRARPSGISAWPRPPSEAPRATSTPPERSAPISRNRKCRRPSRTSCIRATRSSRRSTTRQKADLRRPTRAREPGEGSRSARQTTPSHGRAAPDRRANAGKEGSGRREE